jgi:hypothetical protein
MPSLALPDYSGDRKNLKMFTQVALRSHRLALEYDFGLVQAFPGYGNEPQSPQDVRRYYLE